MTPEAIRQIIVTVDGHPTPIPVDGIRFIDSLPTTDADGPAKLTLDDNTVLCCKESYRAVRVMLDPFEVLPSVEFDERLQ